MTHILIKASKKDLEQAQAKALENNTEGLAFVDENNDSYTINEIREKLNNFGISAAMFETYTGDYSNIFVKFNYERVFENANVWYRAIETKFDMLKNAIKSHDMRKNLDKPFYVFHKNEYIKIKAVRYAFRRPYGYTEYWLIPCDKKQEWIKVMGSEYIYR